MKKNIPLLDLMFYLGESGTTPMHVGVVLVFDPPTSGTPNAARAIATAYRNATPVSPFDLVPEFPQGRRPRWVKAAAIDMAHHVQLARLPAPGTRAQLQQFVAKLHEPCLDRDRPAFQMFVIDGLDDGSFALYCKIHHGIVDGISAILRVVASLNETARARRCAPFFAVDLDAPARPAAKGRMAGVQTLVATAWKQAAAATELSANVVKVSAASLLARQPVANRPFTGPRSPLNAPNQAARAFTMLALPLDAMKAAGRPFGATLNDVAATIVDAALQRYLADLGQAPDRPLVAGCAVSLRDPGDREAATKATAIFVPLGAPRATIVERIEQTAAAMRSAKAEVGALSKDAARSYALLSFGVAEALAATGANRLVPPAANFVLSNVPGARTDLYLRGSRLAGMYPISALGMGIGLNVTLVSHANTVNFGFLTNAAALPDPGGLAIYTREAFMELAAAAAGIVSASKHAGDRHAKVARCRAS